MHFHKFYFVVRFLHPGFSKAFDHHRFWPPWQPDLSVDFTDRDGDAADRPQTAKV